VQSQALEGRVRADGFDKRAKVIRAGKVGRASKLAPCVSAINQDCVPIFYKKQKNWPPDRSKDKATGFPPARQ
jgi:hypothetical protein